jgi:tocopherol O-methyltransferase
MIRTQSLRPRPMGLSMGFRSRLGSFFRRGKKRLSDSELKSGIAKFYDESSGIWLDVWGEHMHHGYYPYPTYKDHFSAQIGMIERSLGWAYGKDAFTASPKNMVDVGCGVGGSSRYISRKYGCDGVGVSLSPFQIAKAMEFTKKSGQLDKLRYEVADAMNMPFTSDTFDLTWSMESGEHMPDKKAFMNELFRVTAPGGRIIIVTWCHRELNEGETQLTDKEIRLLGKINDAYYLPDWVPASHYVQLAKELGLQDVKSDDWSDYIAPFWGAVFKSALPPRNFFRLLRTGKTTVKGAMATLWMLRGFQKGLIKFALITAKKPNVL